MKSFKRNAILFQHKAQLVGWRAYDLGYSWSQKHLLEAGDRFSFAEDKMVSG